MVVDQIQDLNVLKLFNYFRVGEKSYMLDGEDRKLKSNYFV